LGLAAAACVLVLARAAGVPLLLTRNERAHRRFESYLSREWPGLPVDRWEGEKVTLRSTQQFLPLQPDPLFADMEILRTWEDYRRQEHLSDVGAGVYIETPDGQPLRGYFEAGGGQWE